MKTYAISVKEIHKSVILVEAESLEQAIKMTEKFNSDVGFELDEITDMEIEKSENANSDGTATKEQLLNCRYYRL